MGGDTGERMDAGSRARARCRPVFCWCLLAFLLTVVPIAQAEVDLLSEARWAVSDERLSPGEASALDYQRAGAASLNLGPYQGWLWLRVRLDGESLAETAVDEPRWLAVRWPYFRDLRVFLRDPAAAPGSAAGEWREVREASEVGDLLDMPDHTGRLLAPFDGERELLIQLRADGPSALRLTLGSIDEERAHSLVRYTLFGVYLGAMLGMAAYSLFLMLAVRERTYLSYAVFLAVIVLYIGLRYDIPTPWLPEWLRSVPPGARAQLGVALVALSAVWFMRRFLRTQRDDRRVDLVLLGIMVIALLSMPVSIWLAGVASFTVIAVYSVATVITIVWAALRAMRRGFEPAGYLLLGWSVFALAALLYLAMLLGWLPYTTSLMLALPIGSLAQALLLAFALGNRIRHKQREEAVLAGERDRYRFLSEQDGLTGLFNRRALDRRLDLAVAASLRAGTPLSLIVLDTDRFKDYNDRYGHLAGDDVLRCLARVMEANVREGDLCFRYGGEEFVVLLPGQALAQATVVAERIREAFRESSASDLGPGGTVSLGVAQLREGDTANTLLARADAALYHAKEGGRDRVELAH